LNNNRNAGFSTIFLVMILSSLGFLLLVLLEAACGQSIASQSGAYMDLTGRSVLAEYDKDLFDAYGIFALQQSETYMREKASGYLEFDTENSSGITSMAVEDVCVSGASFPGLSCTLLEKQLVKLGKEVCLYSALTNEDLSQICGQFFSLTEDVENLGDRSMNELNDYIEQLEASSSSDSPSEGETENPGMEQASNLKQQYENASHPNLQSDTPDVLLSSLTHESQLPSRLLGVKQSVLPQFSPDLNLGDNFFTDMYLRFVCSCGVKKRANCLYPAEAEYLLFGKDSSAANERAMKQLLFDLRFALQLAAIYADSVQLAEIQTEALAFTPVPQPVAAFVIACTRASVKAIGEVDALCEGKRVPMLPDIICKSGRNPKLSYEDYLLIFLLCMDQNMKIIRFMDIVQCNMQRQEADFCFQNCCYGITLRARFVRNPSHLLSSCFPQRSKSMEREYGYQ